MVQFCYECGSPVKAHERCNNCGDYYCELCIEDHEEECAKEDHAEEMSEGNRERFE